MSKVTMERKSRLQNPQNQTLVQSKATQGDLGALGQNSLNTDLIGPRERASFWWAALLSFLKKEYLDSHLSPYHLKQYLPNAVTL